MNDRLKSAIDALRGLDPNLAPYPRAKAREDALIEGLNGLAAEFGLEIAPTRIDGNGELPFNIVGPSGVGPGRACGQFGEDLAALLSLVPRRTGVISYGGPVLPENGWCCINHFDAERLIEFAAERLGYDETPAAGPRR